MVKKHSRATRQSPEAIDVRSETGNGVAKKRHSAITKTELSRFKVWDVYILGNMIRKEKKKKKQGGGHRSSERILLPTVIVLLSCYCADTPKGPRTTVILGLYCAPVGASGHEMQVFNRISFNSHLFR